MNTTASHFAKILYSTEDFLPRKFEEDLVAIMSDNAFNMHDFMFDIRTGLNELLNEFEQDVSTDNEERVIQVKGVFEKIEICKRLGFRDEIILMALSSISSSLSENRTLLADKPELVIRMLAINTIRMANRNYTHIGTDALGLALINTFPIVTIESAKLKNGHLRLLFKCTDRADYLGLMDNEGKRATLDQEFSL
jgi:hypothetical protein